MPHTLQNVLPVTQGDSIATIPARGSFMAIDGDSLAVQCLRKAIDRSGLPQKQLTGRWSLKQFNKLINGRQSTPLAMLDEVPLEIADVAMRDWSHANGRLYVVPTTEEVLERRLQATETALRAALDLIDEFRRGRR